MRNIWFLCLVPFSLTAHECKKCHGGQERFLEFEYDSSWEPPEEQYYHEEDLGADWPGKREDPFYDTLTR